MARWTEAQVVKLAPDDASISAARRLTDPALWSETGSTDLLVWGKCQGSGKAPYQVSVDLLGPAFRCSCPSRKFPCKHGLALLLLWARGTGVSEASQAAAFAQEWAEGRPAPSVSRPARTETSAAPDPAAQARRLQERLALMSAGIDDFARWLCDLVRAGTAAARQQPYAWWDETAARLVDAQLPGLATQVRDVASDVHRRDDWADHLLARCGRWWTATHAWRGRDALDGDSFADLRAYVGWSTPSAEVRAAGIRSASFTVLGGHRTDDGRLRQQRTWLREDGTGEIGLLLEFSVGPAPLAAPQLAGTRLTATVADYPGSWPRRLLLVDEPTATGSSAELPDGSTIAAVLHARAARLAVGPWSDRLPVVLAGVTPVSAASAATTASAASAASVASAVSVASTVTEDGRGLRDAAGDRLDLVDDAAWWSFLALTGGGPVDVFGELEGGRFRPLTVPTPEGLAAL